MTTICRIPLKLGDDVPEVACTFEDGFMVVRAPVAAQIIDPPELCQRMRCRKLVAVSNGRNLTHCEEHAAYFRTMQRQNYAKQKSKNVLLGCISKMQQTTNKKQKEWKCRALLCRACRKTQPNRKKCIQTQKT